MDWYKDKHFILPDGAYHDKIIAPGIYADAALEYGFRYKDEQQKLRENMTIYPSFVFAGNMSQDVGESYAVHCCRGSWREKPSKTIFSRIKRAFTDAKYRA
jgi:hypothetical protein